MRGKSSSSGAAGKAGKSSATAGYFDLQVNGYAGVDFLQDDLSADGLHRACQLLAEHGNSGILATITTQMLPTMAHRLANLACLRAADELATRMIAGIHIEGPFLNEQPGFRGAHMEKALRPADLDSMKTLLDAAAGLTRLVTLAPERDPGLKVTRHLAKAGIVVSAGHSDASLDQLRAAIDAGLSMFTHLGNGCPMQTHRHDNIVQRALSLHDKLWLCFIADGAHVPFFALGNYLRAIDLKKCVIVTDAVAPAGLGPGRYTVGHWNVDVGEDLVLWAPDRSHLLGAAITMPLTARNLAQQLGLSPAQIRLVMCDNPRRSVGLPVVKPA